ncbi:MAG TPA: biotin/lipoyl-binding protein, partial [Polymorphobacter sp.]|nr:biotin/lipoyl-binding protein [Polymorphobacter sp.]
MRFSAASAAILTLLALAGCARDPVGDRPDYVATASGRLDARVEARFLAAERDGRIEALLVRPGAKVAAGQSLLTIGCGDVAAQADAARAQARASDADARL